MSGPPSSSRTVARPVANLGNTCYMNCVLQALAHAPELCLAIDCDPHRAKCPYARKKLQRRSSSRSPQSSSDEDDPLFTPQQDDDLEEEEDLQKPRRIGTRKSSRRSLAQDADGSSDSNSREDKVEFCVLCEFEEHFRKVHNASRKDKPVVPSTFVNGFVEHVAPWFKLGVQEDSHEFLRLLIDAMQNSCLRARTPTGRKDAPHELNAGSGEKDADTEYPFSLFRGMVESNVTCESCGATSSTHDPIEDIGLDVNNASSPQPGDYHRSSASASSSRTNSPVPPPLADVQSALSRFARAEPLDANYKCEKCGKVGKATKQSRLASIPPILTLQLKRFRYGDHGRSAAAVSNSQRARRSEVNQLQDTFYMGKSGSAKIEGPVKFDTFFDLRPYLTDELRDQLKDKNRKMSYCRLFAVIVHAGKNSHSGHYIAYVSNVSKNEWWRMDDGRVSPVTEQEVKQAEAYMLFYRVVGHPVARHFEELNKKQQEALREQMQEKEEVVVVSRAEGTKQDAPEKAPVEMPPKRKRQAPGFDDGVEWACTKTSIPPHLLGMLRKAQECIADEIQLSPDFFQSLTALATRNPSSSPPPIGEENIIGGVDRFRSILRDLFYILAKHIDSSSDPPPTSWILPAMSNDKTTHASNGKKNTSTESSEKRIAVVEPEDADLL